MKEHLTQHAQQTAADIGTAVAGASFLGISLADWEVMVNIGVGLVGMVAGVAAAWWHIERIVEARRERRRASTGVAAGAGQSAGPYEDPAGHNRPDPR